MQMWLIKKSVNLLAMSKYLFLLAGWIGLIGCTDKQEGFEVTMNLKNAVDGTVYVSQRVPDPTVWYTDTLLLKDGKLVFKGKLDYPRLVSFVFKNEEEDFHGSFGIFLDNSRVTVTGDYQNLKQVKIEGSKAHDEYMAIGKKGEKLFKEYGRLTYKRSQAFKNDRALYDSLGPACDEAYDKVFRYITTLPGYAHSEVAAHFVREYFNTSDMEKLEKALDGFAPEMVANPLIADCRKDLENEKRVAPGQKAYDFTLKDIEGKTYRLSDFRGKYVLLEFSASWCGWCKLEIPYLQTVYKNTRGKDFVMFTVNLDEDRAKWEEDVKKHQLPWPVISDLEAFKSPVAQNYNVSGIPAIYLIDPQGVIEAKGLRREKMIEYINTILNE